MPAWRPPIERFENFIERVPESGCWIWLGSGTKEGYGRMQIGRKKVLVHRWSYETFVGAIPDGMLVLHRCDVTACANPYHLFLGTNLTNTLDKIAKNRQARGADHAAWCRGELQHRAKLTREHVVAIRNDPRSQSTIALEYGLTQSYVSELKRRAKWKHV